MTPAELSRRVNAYRERRRQQSKNELRAAWHTAALSRTQNFPSLDDFLNPVAKDATLLEGEELERRQAELEELSKRFGV